MPWTAVDVLRVLMPPPYTRTLEISKYALEYADAAATVSIQVPEHVCAKTAALPAPVRRQNLVARTLRTTLPTISTQCDVYCDVLLGKIRIDVTRGVRVMCNRGSPGCWVRRTGIRAGIRQIRRHGSTLFRNHTLRDNVA